MPFLLMLLEFLLGLEAQCSHGKYKCRCQCWRLKTPASVDGRWGRSRTSISVAWEPEHHHLGPVSLSRYRRRWRYFVFPTTYTTFASHYRIATAKTQELQFVSSKPSPFLFCTRGPTFRFSCDQPIPGAFLPKTFGIHFSEKRCILQ